MLTLSFGMLAPWVWYRRRGIRYEITEERIIKHTGRLGSATEEISFEDISRVRTSQSLGERLFGVGTIVVDTGVDHLELAAVPNHDRVVETIRNQQTS